MADLRSGRVYEGRQIEQSRVIMLGVRHDYDGISAAPEPTAGIEVMAK